MARESDGKVIYDEDIFRMGIELYESVDVPLDIIYHLLKNKKIDGFSIILFQSDFEDFENFLKKTKRKTDFLLPVDREKQIYVMLCQETQVDGGFYFVKRLDREMQSLEEGREILAAIVGVESTRYSVRDLLFIILDTYLKVLNDKENSIVFRTVR